MPGRTSAHSVPIAQVTMLRTVAVVRRSVGHARLPAAGSPPAQPYSRPPCLTGHMALQESPPPSLHLASGHDHQRALVERARRGDAAAQRALYDTNVDRVYRLAFRLSGRDDVAREMTQDAFVRAFARLGEFREES